MMAGLAIAAAIALGAVLVYAATRPDTMHIERAIVIEASPQQVQPLIDSLRQMNRWNPFTQKDPAIRLVYSGPERGPGAALAFAGDKNVGEGRIEIVTPSAPGQVTMKLDMLKPFEGHSTIDFTVTPDGSRTRVRWAMRSAMTYPAKLMHLVFRVETMIRRDFDRGLMQLKKLAELA